jgi:uncharacterized protein YdhG (YjbR/CyaY superfamily)
MFTNKAATVAEYLEALPAERRAIVSKVRTAVKKAMPKGYAESINFGAITYAIPLKRYPDTYNKQPLCYAAIAAQKNYYSLYLMGVYGDPKKEKWLADEFKKRGLKLDKGKACIRFTSLDELPLDVVAQIVSSTPVEQYIEVYEAGRKKTAKGK